MTSLVDEVSANVAYSYVGETRLLTSIRHYSPDNGLPQGVPTLDRITYYDPGRDVIRSVDNNPTLSGLASLFIYDNDMLRRRTQRSRHGAEFPVADTVDFRLSAGGRICDNPRSEVTNAVSNVNTETTYGYEYDSLPPSQRCASLLRAGGNPSGAGSSTGIEASGVSDNSAYTNTYGSSQLNTYNAITTSVNSAESVVAPLYDSDGSMTNNGVPASSGNYAGTSWSYEYNGDPPSHLRGCGVAWNRLAVASNRTTNVKVVNIYPSVDGPSSANIGRRVVKSVYDDLSGGVYGSTNSTAYQYDGY